VSGSDGGIAVLSLPGGTTTVTVLPVRVQDPIELSGRDAAGGHAGDHQGAARRVGGPFAESVQVVAERQFDRADAIAGDQHEQSPARRSRTLPLTSPQCAPTALTVAPGFNTRRHGRATPTVNGLPPGAPSTSRLDGMSIQDNYLKTSDGYFRPARPRRSTRWKKSAVHHRRQTPPDATGQGGVQIRFVTKVGHQQPGTARRSSTNRQRWPEREHRGSTNRDLTPDPATGKAPAGPSSINISRAPRSAGRSSATGPSSSSTTKTCGSRAPQQTL